MLPLHPGLPGPTAKFRLSLWVKARSRPALVTSLFSGHVERQTIVRPRLLPVWSCQSDYLLRAHTDMRENIRAPHGSRNQSSDLLALMRNQQQLHYVSPWNRFHKKKLKLLCYATRSINMTVPTILWKNNLFFSDSVWHNTLLLIYSTAEQCTGSAC